MSLINVMGSQKAYVRCYRLSHGETALHLRSTKRFTNLNEIRKMVNNHSEPGFDGEKALLFVDRDHLPSELLSGLDGSQTFHRFCKVIGFTALVYQLSLGQGLPSSPADHAESTFRRWVGFPITRPARELDLKNSLSFDQLELKGFLGEMDIYAGKMMILPFNDLEGKPMPLSDMRELIQRFSAILQMS